MDIDEPASGAGVDSGTQVPNLGNGNKNEGVLRENVRFLAFFLVISKADVFSVFLPFLLLYESTFSCSLTLTD